MKHYTNSDYALNRYSEGIVYRFADGIVEVTLAGYLAENPGKTEADFCELKALSDGIYHKQDRAYNAQTKKNTPLDNVDEALLCLELSAEETLFDVLDAVEKQNQRQEQLSLASHVLDKLTDVQRKRYLLHVVDGLTTREIAAKEGVAQQVVNKSILAAKKKIKKVLAAS